MTIFAFKVTAVVVVATDTSCKAIKVARKALEHTSVWVIVRSMANRLLGT